MRAIQSTSLGKAEIVDIPEPELKPDSILVRPSYVANNPCDPFTIDLDSLFEQGQINGCDYAGTVENVGANVKTTLKPGDKVYGVVAAGVACDTTRGAFAELIPAYGDFCFPLPKGVSVAGAATLGVGMSTICLSFYQDFGFPMPDEDPKFGKGKSFLVYGGSTATGLLAIQFAKLSGFNVITTCSPHNFELVKARGADEAYDYHDFDKCVQDTKKSTGDDLQYAFVCVVGEEPAKLCEQVLSSKGAKLVTIVGTQCPRANIEVIMTFGQAVMVDAYKDMMGGVAKQKPEEKALGQKFFKLAGKLLEEGKIQPPPLDVREGLEGALQGIDDLRNGWVSGKKIVSRLV